MRCKIHFFGHTIFSIRFFCMFLPALLPPVAFCRGSSPSLCHPIPVAATLGGMVMLMIMVMLMMMMDYASCHDNHDDDHDGSCVLLAMSMTDCLLMDGLVISRTTVVCEPQIQNTTKIVQLESLASLYFCLKRLQIDIFHNNLQKLLRDSLSVLTCEPFQCNTRRVLVL